MANDKTPPSREADKFVIRFPPGMRKRIAEIAQVSHRSMNNEIVWRLEKSLDDPVSLLHLPVAIEERLRHEADTHQITTADALVRCLRVFFEGEHHPAAGLQEEIANRLSAIEEMLKEERNKKRQK